MLAIRSGVSATAPPNSPVPIARARSRCQTSRTVVPSPGELCTSAVPATSAIRRSTDLRSPTEDTCTPAGENPTPSSATESTKPCSSPRSRTFSACASACRTALRTASAAALRAASATSAGTGTAPETSTLRGGPPPAVSLVSRTARSAACPGAAGTRSSASTALRHACLTRVVAIPGMLTARSAELTSSCSRSWKRSCASRRAFARAAVAPAVSACSWAASARAPAVRSSGPSTAAATAAASTGQVPCTAAAGPSIGQLAAICAPMTDKDTGHASRRGPNPIASSTVAAVGSQRSPTTISDGRSTANTASVTSETPTAAQTS